jgi:hypothetical protein
MDKPSFNTQSFNTPSNSLTIISESLQMITLFLTYSDKTKIDNALSKELFQVGKRVKLNEFAKKYYADSLENNDPVGKVTKLIYKSFVEVSFPTKKGIFVVIVNTNEVVAAPVLTIELEAKELLEFKQARSTETAQTKSNKLTIVYSNPKIGQRVYYKRRTDDKVGRVSKITRTGTGTDTVTSTDTNFEIEVTFPDENGSKVFSFLITSLSLATLPINKTETPLWKTSNEKDEIKMKDSLEKFDLSSYKDTETDYFTYNILKELNLMKEKYENDINILKKDPIQIRNELIKIEIEQNYILRKLKSTKKDIYTLLNQYTTSSTFNKERHENYQKKDEEAEEKLFEANINVKNTQLKLLVINKIMKEKTEQKTEQQIQNEINKYILDLKNYIYLENKKIMEDPKDTDAYESNIKQYKTIIEHIKKEMKKIVQTISEYRTPQQLYKIETDEQIKIETEQKKYNGLKSSDSKKQTIFDALYKHKVEYEDVKIKHFKEITWIRLIHNKNEGVKELLDDWKNKFIESIKDKRDFEINKLNEEMKQNTHPKYYNVIINRIIDFIMFKSKHITYYFSNIEPFKKNTVEPYLIQIIDYFKLLRDKYYVYGSTIKDVDPNAAIKISDFIFNITQIHHNANVRLEEEELTDKSLTLQSYLLLIYEKEYQYINNLKPFDNSDQDYTHLVEYLQLNKSNDEQYKILNKIQGELITLQRTMALVDTFQKVIEIEKEIKNEEIKVEQLKQIERVAHTRVIELTAINENSDEADETSIELEKGKAAAEHQTAKENLESASAILKSKTDALQTINQSSDMIQANKLKSNINKKNADKIRAEQSYEQSVLQLTVCDIETFNNLQQKLTGITSDAQKKNFTRKFNQTQQSKTQKLANRLKKRPSAQPIDPLVNSGTQLVTSI